MALVGLYGPRAQRCRATLAQLLGERVRLVEPAQIGIGSPQLVPGEDLTADELIDWLGTRHNRARSSAVVFVAELIEPSTLRIDAFRVPELKRAALKTISIGKSCRISPRLHGALLQWLEGVLRPRPDPRRPAPPPRPIEPPPPEPMAIAPIPPPVPGAPPAETVEPPEEDDFPLPAAISEETAEVQAPAPVDTAEEQGWLALQVGVAMTARSFRYRAARSPGLREYRFDLVPIPEVALVVHPARLLGHRGVLGPLRVDARYDEAVGLRSERSEGGPSLPTRYRDLELGLAYGWRFEIEEHPLTLSPRVGFRYTAFSIAINDDGQREDSLPDAGYASLQAGGALQVLVRPTIGVFAGASYLGVLGLSGIDTPRFFPRTSAHGLALAAGVDVRLVPAIELQFGARYLRYFLGFDLDATALRVADGADDENLALTVALRWVGP